MKQISVALLTLCLMACGNRKETAADSSRTGSTQNAPDYTPRIGVAVITGARTCVAIHNSTLAPNAVITLVSTLAPQSLTQAEVTGTASTPCPVSKNVDPAISSYDLHASGTPLPKNTPLIAVVGSSAAFTVVNNSVTTDLDQNGHIETFRACSANDGVHLTVWSAGGLLETPLWHGYYYEPDNPGIGPACTAKETAGPAAGA